MAQISNHTETTSQNPNNSQTPSRQADNIPASLLQQINETIARYPVSKRSASLPILHLWQNHFGYIDDSAIEWIAHLLDLQPINIYELVTFYPWFRQSPPAKNIIRVCRTLSCALAGSYEIFDKFCHAIGIDPHLAAHHDGLINSPCGNFSIQFVECLASCGTAPVCLINDDLYEKLTPNDIPKILEKLKTNSEQTPNTP
ncbi:MAG: NAD(P)H-dependent oxidoreductase subunit E [Chthoniobacterales bacterium]|nr:NAD(P)H-dependent oxidoreductase subunit E [Chthoniobacterales bacterium]